MEKRKIGWLWHFIRKLCCDTRLIWIRPSGFGICCEVFYESMHFFYDNVAPSKQSENGFMVLPCPPDKTMFDAMFRALLRRSETMGRRAQGGSAAAGSESFNQADFEDDDMDENDDPAEVGKKNGLSDDNDGSIDVAAGIARVKERQRRKNQSTSTTANEGKASKKGKEKTVWHDGKGKVTKSALANLDRSKEQDKSSALDSIDAAVADDSNALAEARAAYLPASGETPLWEEEDILDDYDDDDGSDEDGEEGGGGWGSSLKGLFSQMSGNKVLTSSDLDAPLDDMQKMLTSKNVANDIAKEICDSVRSKLVGKKMQSFMRVKTAVRHALEASIEKILRPAHNRDVDLLRSAVAKREKGKGFFASKSKPTRPYVIVMIGINGVGKSTSLAKIAYYLKSNGCSPLLAACDTFRSGAVEQLNVHAKCLDVPLYHKGYAKDPSAVAKAAIDHAAQEGNDVVLVDTAGRMQNNVPLMKALSKLVVENDPDLVLFVCEALVGNDGMDQLFMFDKALSSGGHSRQIDGIVLTKFDTVSDKVGAALTMTHLTGAPVVFVGTGQKYNHLKKLGAQSVIKSIFT
uniref:SRP54-type proteins GTP-binding domain-containing protein n=1 Tax=Ditylum brightwellii TaxID=49249 RepID=A0A7S4SSQ4_9STRA